MAAPKYNLGQVSPKPMPTIRRSYDNTRASAESFGAGEARDMGGFGRALQGTGEVIQERVDRSVVRDTLNKARTEAREYMAELSQRKGKDALTVYDEAKDRFGKLRKESHKSMLTPRQQRLFDTAFDSISNSNLNSALSHQVREGERFRIATLDAENENELQDAVMKLDTYEAQNGNLQGLYDNYKAIMENTRAKYAPMGQEVVKEQVAKAKSNFHMNVVDKMRHQSTKRAIDYLDKNKKEINPSLFESVKEKLEYQGKEENAHETAKQIFASGGTLQEKLDKIRGLDADISDAVESKVLRWMKQDEAAKKMQTAQQYDQWVDEIEKDPMSVEFPPDMDPSMKAELERYRSKILEPVREEVSFAKMAHMLDPDSGIEDMNPSELLRASAGLTKEDRADVFKERRRRLKEQQTGGTTSRSKKDGPIPFHSDIKMFLQSRGFDPTPKDDEPEKSRMVYEFYRDMKSVVNGMSEEERDKLSLDDMEKIAAKLTMKRMVDDANRGRIFDTDASVTLAEVADPVHADSPEFSRLFDHLGMTDEEKKAAVGQYKERFGKSALAYIGRVSDSIETDGGVLPPPSIAFVPDGEIKDLSYNSGLGVFVGQKGDFVYYFDLAHNPILKTRKADLVLTAAQQKQNAAEQQSRSKAATVYDEAFQEALAKGKTKAQAMGAAFGAAEKWAKQNGAADPEEVQSVWDYIAEEQSRAPQRPKSARGEMDAWFMAGGLDSK